MTERAARKSWEETTEGVVLRRELAAGYYTAEELNAIAQEMLWEIELQLLGSPITATEVVLSWEEFNKLVEKQEAILLETVIQAIHELRTKR